VVGVELLAERDFVDIVRKGWVSIRQERAFPHEEEPRARRCACLRSVQANAGRCGVAVRSSIEQRLIAEAADIHLAANVEDIDNRAYRAWRALLAKLIDVGVDVDAALVVSLANDP